VNKPVIIRRCAKTATALLFSALATLAQSQDQLETVGLAVYTETARDIYIAGLQLPYGAVMQNLMLAPPPKAMEYRIATRRISSRGFSGTLLLQAELGSGGRAPESAINALEALKRNMKGSLKLGDQFKIYLAEDDTTHFILNGTELVSVPDGGVFDFFYSGWVGDGAASTLRDPLLSGTLDPAIMSRYQELSPSDTRIAAIAAWTAAPTPQPRQAPNPAPEISTPAETVADASAAGTAASKAVASAAAETETSTQASAPVPQPQKQQPAVEKQPTPEPAAVAVVQPQPVPEPADDTAESKLEIDDREYQRQVQLYVNDIMVAVYREVTYPRRAVKYNWEGKVEILATLDASGKLISAEIDQESGHGALDKAAQDAVEKASPFPALTPVAREEFAADDGTGYLVSIPITFALQ
jgi:TonB family protein